MYKRQLYNKPFEDERIHLKTSSVQFNANMESLRNYDWKNSISIASYFSGIEPIKNRICIIDTPGVNAASYREHSEITHKALLNCKYDKPVSYTHLDVYKRQARESAALEVGASSTLVPSPCHGAVRV